MALEDIDSLNEEINENQTGHIDDHKKIVRGLKSVKQETANKQPVEWAPFPQRITMASTSAAGGRYPGWLSSDGTRLFTFNRSMLRISDNEGTSWTDVFEFANVHSGAGVQAVRETGDGELLVFTGGPSPARGRVYRSTGYSVNPTTATWSMRKEMANDGDIHAQAWSVDVHDSGVAVMTEYGPKSGATSARYVYVSVDYGQNWAQKFDRFQVETGTPTDMHMHGGFYDPIWDRLWVSYGDATNGIAYSDNWRDATPTWQHAYRSSTVGGKFQSVGMIMFDTCILLMSDGWPNGINRIPRFDSNGLSTKSNPQIENAYALDGTQFLGWLGAQPFRPKHIDPAPVFIPFRSSASQRKQGSRIIVTVDGYSFTEIWRDKASYDVQSRSGIETVLGPTAQNNRLIGIINDGKYDSVDYTKFLTATGFDIVRQSPGKTGQMGVGDVDELKPGHIGAEPGWHLLQPPAPLLSYSNPSTNSANQARGHIVKASKRGRIVKPHILVGTSAGNIEVALYSNTTTRQKLWTSGAIACPTSGWAQIADDINVTCEAGDTFYWYVTFSDATATCMKVGQGFAGMIQLPSGLNEDTTRPLKLLEYLTTSYAPGTLPATIAEASAVASTITSVPMVIAKIDS